MTQKLFLTVNHVRFVSHMMQFTAFERDVFVNQFKTGNLSFKLNILHTSKKPNNPETWKQQIIGFFFKLKYQIHQ